MNYKSKVQNHDLCYDIMLNNFLSQKLYPIGTSEFNYLFNIRTKITKKKKCFTWKSVSTSY